MPSTSADEFQDGLKIERTALFLDVDGTLLDLAPRPGAVFVPPSLIDSLARADEALGGALALVSGRSSSEQSACGGTDCVPDDREVSGRAISIGIPRP